MKYPIKTTLRLTLSAIALFLLWMFLQKQPEPFIAYEQDAGEEASEVEVSEDSYRLECFDPDREIRVLLANPSGGYFFETIDIVVKERTYHFTEKEIMRRGMVRIQAGEERIEFRQKQGESCPALYPGSLILRCKEQGIYVVNSLPLETYLTLVVPGEMPASYPEEALKSQAVLARTYAVRHMLQPALREYGADLDDTTAFQVYGENCAQESATKAVEDTAGSILCADEGVADIYYFSTSCGQTTTTEAWNRAVPTMEKAVYVGEGESAFAAEELQKDENFEIYIENRNDNDYEREVPWYRWEYQAKLDPQRLFQRIKERYEVQPSQILSRPSGKSSFSEEYPMEPGRIWDISVTKRSPGGCASELTIFGVKGDIKIRTEYSIRYVLCDTVSEVVLQDGSTRRMGTILPSAFFIIKTGKERQDVIGYTLVGGGFGHGIGMSQNAASAMAKTGLDYRQIIYFFYPEYQLMQLQRVD